MSTHHVAILADLYELFSATSLVVMGVISSHDSYCKSRDTRNTSSFERHLRAFSFLEHLKLLTALML